MQFRGLLIALVVLAALSGGLWWSNHRPQADPTKISDSNREQLMTLLLDELTEVSISHKGDPATKMRRNGQNKWELVLDPPVPVDYAATADVVNSVATISADQLIEESSADLAQFGLDPGEFVLTTKDRKGRTQQLIIGETAPIGGKYYARRPTEKKVFAIAEYFVIGFNKSVNDLRDKRLLALDDVRLSRFELQRSGVAFGFSRASGVPWKMQKPQPFRIDSTTVDVLVQKVKELKFDPSLNEEALKKNQAAFASGTRLASFSFEDGGAAKLLELRKTQAGEILAQSSMVKGVYRASAELGKAVEKNLEDYRARKLMDFGFDEPQRVQVDSGGKTNVFENKGEGSWVWNGKKADPSTVNELIRSLSVISAINFVERKFTTAIFSVNVVQKDGKTVEKLEIAKAGNFHYARREGEPGEYEIDPKAFADLEAALGRVKPAGTSGK